MWALTLWNSSTFFRQNFSDAHSSKFSPVKILRHTVYYPAITTCMRAGDMKYVTIWQLLAFHENHVMNDVVIVVVN